MAQAFAKITRGSSSGTLHFGERNGGRGATAPDEVERGVNGGPPQIAFFLGQRRCRCSALQKAQKNGLQNIFGVGGIPGDPVRGPEDEAVIFLKNSAEFRGVRRGRGLSGYDLQAPSCHLSALKTGDRDDYYRTRNKKRTARVSKRVVSC